MSRNRMKHIGEETLQIIDQGGYTNSSGIFQNIKEQLTNSLAKSKLYKPSDFINIKTGEGSLAKTEFSIFSGTTIDALYEIVLNQGKTNVIALNFASAKSPGGGFLTGAISQEESLCRASALYSTLIKHDEYYKSNKQHRNCLYTDYMIYSPDIVIFRDSDSNLLDQPYFASFVTSPAVNIGCLKDNNPDLLNQAPETMYRRLLSVLEVCRENKYQNLVLGAWGCGVFQNDPVEIANLFKKVLTDKTLFGNYFEQIVFAIYDRSKTQHVMNSFNVTVQDVLK